MGKCDAGAAAAIQSIQGNGVGYQFFLNNRDVRQSDHHTAINALEGLKKSDAGNIIHFTSYKKVCRILRSRSLAPMSVNELELGAQARQQGCA